MRWSKLYLFVFCFYDKLSMAEKDSAKTKIRFFKNLM